MKQFPHLNRLIVEELGGSNLVNRLEKTLTASTSQSIKGWIIKGHNIGRLETRQEIQKLCEKMSPGITTKYECFITDPPKHQPSYGSKVIARTQMRKSAEADFDLGMFIKSFLNLETDQQDRAFNIMQQLKG